MRKWVILLIFCLTKFELQAGGWLDRKAEGWAWYEDLKESKNRLESTAIIPGTAVEQVQRIRAEIEETLSKAILEPTLENIKNYLRMQKTWMDQSTLFASHWAKVILNEPQLDNSIHTPTNHFAQKIQRQNEQLILEGRIQSLAPTYALIYFFDSRDHQSEIMADIVKEFSRKFNWKVIAVSKDGKGIRQFPNPVPDKGIWGHVSVELPSLCTVNPLTEQVWKVGVGILSIEQIVENIAIQHNLKR